MGFALLACHCIFMRVILSLCYANMRPSCVCLCVRVFFCMRRMSLCVRVCMSECVWHMCAMFPHLFMHAFAERSFARRFVCGMLTVRACYVLATGMCVHA